jgi:hypothetical protein
MKTTYKEYEIRSTVSKFRPIRTDGKQTTDTSMHLTVYNGNEPILGILTIARQNPADPYDKVKAKQVVFAKACKEIRRLGWSKGLRRAVWELGEKYWKKSTKSLHSASE